MTGSIFSTIFFGSLPLFIVYVVILSAFMIILKKTNRL